MHLIQLVPYHTKYDDVLSTFTIAKEEQAFALTPFIALQDLAELEYPVVVLYDDTPAGFMRLNLNEERFALTDNPNAILIKSFSVTQNMQGKNIAQSALKQLPKYLKKHFPEVNEIVLSVNFKNEKAIHVYQKIGFVDTNRVLEGHAGKQHIMRYLLD